MKGVILSINPQATIVDISHEVTPQHTVEGGFLLWSSYKFLPHGTLFACVVDPGVGTTRRILFVKTRSYFFLAPENDILEFVLSDEPPLRAMALDLNKASKLTLENISSTFNGRDIFAPLAAHHSLGRDLMKFGTRIPERTHTAPLVFSKDDPIRPSILHIDHFGNIVTNVCLTKEDQGHPAVSMAAVGAAMVSHRITNYQEAPDRTPCLIVGSSGLLEVAVKNDNAARLLGATLATSLKIYWQS